jgi:hypothetical protein
MRYQLWFFVSRKRFDALYPPSGAHDAAQPEPEPSVIRLIGNRAIDDQQVADGKKIYREMLRSDPHWRTQQEAAAEEIKQRLGLTCHWRTVHRWIIEPVNNPDND